jgi:hypothetical protein
MKALVNNGIHSHIFPFSHLNIPFLSIEPIMFSDKIKKVNMFGFVQDRFFVITTERIYNIKKNKVKRFIHINKLSGISKALQGKMTEFTLHVNSEYDYRFHSEKREDIVSIIKQRYLDMMR